MSRPLLLAVVVSCGIVPAYAGDTGKQPTGTLASQGMNNDEVQELKTRLKELEDATRQNYALELDRGRKQVDWWLTLLGILAAIMAIAGGLIPYLMARKDKEIIEQDKTQIKTLLDEVKLMKTEAKDSVEKIHVHESEAEAAKNAVLAFQSGPPTAENTEALKAAATIEQDTKSDPLLRLRAEAISSSKPESAEKAYKLWAALAVLAEKDEGIQFNAGYWAQMLSEHAQAQEKLRILRLAGQHYAQALTIKPDIFWAANNWGNALSAEASALSASDLPSARILWKQAREKYHLALTIKPDMHEAATNWGNSLDAEASVLAASDLPAAQMLWKQAREKYQQVLTIKPDMHEAANNWGNSLDAEASVLAASDLPAARMLWKHAREKYQQALTIQPDKHVAVYNLGNALYAEARALVSTDLLTAQTLWQQAGEKFQQALTLKPDMHEAVYNWGCVLAAEARALPTSDLPAVRSLLRLADEKFRQALALKPDMHQAANNWAAALLHEASVIASLDTSNAAALLGEAEQILLSHAEVVPGQVSYNLACVYGRRGDVQSCLKWLRVAQQHKTLESCEHLRTDKDLNPVRNSPEFIAWLATVCNDGQA